MIMTGYSVELQLYKQMNNYKASSCPIGGKANSYSRILLLVGFISAQGKTEYNC